MKKFTEDDIKRIGLPQDVFDLLHDLCYHVNNNLRGTMDERAIENYVNRAQAVLSTEPQGVSVNDLRQEIADAIFKLQDTISKQKSYGKT